MLSRVWLAGRQVAGDIVPRPQRGEVDLRRRRDAAVDWLCRAQDAAPDGGVSAGFHLKDGWLPSYPETTGYIACTFFELAHLDARPEFTVRAWRMIDWLLTLQHEAGGFPGQFGDRSPGPIVFNTGQVLHGLLHAFELDATRGDVADAARRAARWLTTIMDADGCWRTHTHAGIPHAYNTRTAWALLRCHRLLGDEQSYAAGVRNLHWAQATQRPGGWIEQAWFRQGAPPFLHTIAYAVRGLLECGLLLDDEPLIACAHAAADPLARQLVDDGALAGAYDVGWEPVGRYRCLTGEAQMAICWAKLFERTGAVLFRDACERAVRFVGSTQRLSGNPNVRGAIAGSSPIWGGYARFEFPNWAAKFFVDALIACERISPGAVRLQEETACA